MVFDPDLKMMRGFTFFEQNIPKYATHEECMTRGMDIIAETKKELRQLNIRTGDFEIDCIEVKRNSI